MNVRRRLLQLVFIIIAVIVFGTAGYVLIERFTLFDALYMTIITVASVGYGEIPRELTTAGRAFTMVLIVLGLGSMAYGLSAITALWVEGDISHSWEKRKMQARIAKLEKHIVVCGGGQTGRHIAGELLKTRTPFVLIERSASEEEELRKLGDDVLYLIGDANNPEVLRAARIQVARGLISCMPSDKDNVFTLLSARELNPAMRTVSRLVADEARGMLVRAGADAIVSIPTIGALRLAAVMLRPVVVGVLDAMLRDPGDMRVEEFSVGITAAGKTLAGVHLREQVGIIIFAVRQADGRHTFNPPSQYVLHEGDVLIGCASPEQITAARKLVGGA